MLIIGNPENRRVTQFQEALHGFKQAPARVISYADILENRIVLQDALAGADCIRIESPGENFQVEKRILEMGGLESAMTLPEDNGRIYFPGVWYKGFQKLLNTITTAAGDVVWFNHPEDIITMFNKPLTKKINSAHCLPSLPDFANYDDFLAYVESQPHSRFFIKLNYSSSASGVLAFEYNRKTRKAQAQTTIELVRNGSDCYFYNSLKLKKYSYPNDLADILNFLFQQGAYVEPWIAKAQHDEGVFDLRVLAINCKRQHCIARVSKTPITNLHLGNQRCAVDDLEISSAQWQQIDKLVEDVMQNFSKSLYSGLDILLPRDENKLPVLLEANAFGDLLPGLLYQNQSTYHAELAALYQQYPQTMSKAA
jgi:hypothetical protein